MKRILYLLTFIFIVSCSTSSFGQTLPSVYITNTTGVTQIVALETNVAFSPCSPQGGASGIAVPANSQIGLSASQIGGHGHVFYASCSPASPCVVDDAAIHQTGYCTAYIKQTGTSNCLASFDIEIFNGNSIIID